MTETNGRPSKLKSLSDELDAKSQNLKEEDIPHFFWIMDTSTREVGFWGNLGDGKAYEIVHWDRTPLPEGEFAPNLSFILGVQRFFPFAAHDPG